VDDGRDDGSRSKWPMDGWLDSSYGLSQYAVKDFKSNSEKTPKISTLANLSTLIFLPTTS
jgi:hypothetical protein